MDPFQHEAAVREIEAAVDHLRAALAALDSSPRVDSPEEVALAALDCAHSNLKAARSRVRVDVMAPMSEWR